MLEESLNRKPLGENIENNEKLDLKVEIAKEKDWEDYKTIRLEAIEAEPLAFYVTKSRKENDLNKTEEEWKKDLIGVNTFVVLAKNGDAPVGLAHALIRDLEKEQWGIRSVYLRKDFRGGGSGEKMMNLIINEIKRRKGKEVVLNVADTQKSAKKLYEKLGFKMLDRFEPEEEEGKIWPGGYFMIKEIE